VQSAINHFRYSENALIGADLKAFVQVRLVSKHDELGTEFESAGY